MSVSSQLAAQLQKAFSDDDILYQVLPPEVAEDGTVAAESLVLYYVKPTALMERLDACFGIDGWSTQAKDIEGPGGKRGVAVSLIVTIEGRDVIKTGVGNQHASGFEGVVGAYDGAMGRAAAQLGIGRYLWELPEVRIELTDDGNLTKHPLDALLEVMPQA